MDFFDRVKELIKENTNLTLRAFIESQGLNYETYYSGKRRENLPRADEAQKIAQALNTTVEYLVTGKTSNQSAADEALDKIKTIVDVYKKLS